MDITVCQFIQTYLWQILSSIVGPIILIVVLLYRCTTRLYGLENAMIKLKHTPKKKLKHSIEDLLSQHNKRAYKGDNK